MASNEKGKRLILAKASKRNAIFAVLIVTSAVLSTFCCHSDETPTVDDAAIALGAVLGSISCIIGLVSSDSSVHALFLGLATFVTIMANGAVKKQDLNEVAREALVLSCALFAVPVSSSLPGDFFAFLGSDLVLNSFVVTTACALPVTSLLLGSVLLTHSSSWDSISYPTGVISFVAIVAMLVMAVYYEHGSHKQAHLTIDSGHRGVAVATALSIAWTIHASIQAQDQASVLLPMFVGSLLTTLMCMAFAAVANRWDVGDSIQFQMISFDSAALMIYAAFTLSLILYFVIKRGDEIGEFLKTLIREYLTEEMVADSKFPPAQMVTFGFFFLVGLPSMIGIPLMVSLSPLGAYLFSMAYTHGQRGSGKLALLVHLSDLLTEGSSKQENKAEVDKFISEITKHAKTAKINIFVTAKELQQHAESIRKLASAGHYIGIFSDSAIGTKTVYMEYARLFKKRAEWFHVGPKGSAAASPAMLKCASHFQLRIALWSNHIALSSLAEVQKTEIPKLRGSAADKGGGLFIYINKGSPSCSAGLLVSALLHIMQGLNSDGYSFDPLPVVAIDESVADK